MNITNIVKKYRFYFIGALLLTVFALIVRFISNIDFYTLKTYLYQMPEMFLAIIICSFIAYLASSMSWIFCMGDDGKKFSITEIFIYRLIGEMLAVFNPTSIVAGDSLKTSYLYKKGVTKHNALSSVLLSRVLNFLSAIFLVVIASVYFIVFKNKDQKNIYIILAAVSVLIILGYVLSRLLLDKTLFFSKIIRRISIKTGWKFLSENTLTSCYEINATLSCYFHEDRRKFMTAFFLSVIHWIFGALEFYIILRTLGINVSIIDVISVEMGVMLFKTVGSIIPGQLGVEEYGNKVMLNTIGIMSNEIWLVASLARRTRQLFWLGLSGILVLATTKSVHIKLHK